MLNKYRTAFLSSAQQILVDRCSAEAFRLLTRGSPETAGWEKYHQVLEFDDCRLVLLVMARGETNNYRTCRVTIFRLHSERSPWNCYYKISPETTIENPVF